MKNTSQQNKKGEKSSFPLLHWSKKKNQLLQLWEYLNKILHQGKKVNYYLGKVAPIALLTIFKMEVTMKTS